MKITPVVSGAILFASFILLWESYGSDLAGLAKMFFLPMLAFCLSSALFAKILAKADFVSAAIKSLAAFSAFLFVSTAGLALFGALPAAFLFSSWFVPFIAAAALLFAGWSVFAYVHLSEFSALAPQAGLPMRLAVFIMSVLAMLAVTYLLGISFDFFKFNPGMPYG
ncbi:MAG: hypothetical protein V1708_02370 [Candidatus Micrarchaeota archaeon]